MSAGTFWHGSELDEWANEWTRYYTGGKGNYMISAMEDTGTLQALTFLNEAGRVDLRRVLVLRTASNYTTPPPGKSAAWSATAEYPGEGVPALEAAYQTGNIVVQALLKDWSRYRDAIPGH